MQTLKNIKIAMLVMVIFSFLPLKAKTAEECFEKVSRSIFKFNMALDDVIIEPIAKGYNKLPDPIKNGTSNL